MGQGDGGDRQIDGVGSPGPTGRSRRLSAGAPGKCGPGGCCARAAAPTASRGRDTVFVWLIAILGVLGAVALYYWPYNKTCGTWLYGYLIGVAAVAGCGLMTMRSSWTHRRGLAHAVGLLTFLAGLAFAAAEILPRTGYAAESRTWTCPS
ncbi:MAG: hypothetical protein IPO52_10940 [Gemmatimonadetes bacterium]|nr:hypothetical protein [Gemmatimonadota bacterium]